MKFTIIDKTTGKSPDMEQIALTEAWAKGLVFCDMEGFAVLSDGTLILCDECGNYAICPEGRFEIIIETVGTSPAQKCPVCNGTGLVSVPPGVAGDLETFTATEMGPWPCRTCNGSGIALWCDRK